MLEAVFRLELKSRPEVLSVSEGVEALLGYTAEDLISSKVSFGGLVHPNDSDIASRLFSPRAKDHSGDVNIRLRHADGRIRCLRGHFIRELPHNGHPVLDLILRDMGGTQFWEADSVSEVNLKAYMESVDELVHFKDRNHVITLANRNFRRLFSESVDTPRELTGLTDYDLFPENIADEFYELEKRVLKGMPAAHVVQHMLGKEDKRDWLDIRKFPVRNDGHIIGVLTVLSFITEAVISTHALTEGESSSLKDAHKAAAMGSYEMDLNTGTWSSSDALDGVFGIDKNYERTRDGLKNLLHPDDRGVMPTHFDEHDLALHFTKEFRIIRPADGSIRWVQENARLEPDAQGRPAVLRGTIRDITAQKHAEAVTHRRRDLLQRFISLAPAALAMFDREMRYLAVSRRWLEENALVGKDIIGRLHYEVIPDIPEYWKETHKRGLAGEKLRKEEDRFERADGTLQWIRWEMVPWRMDDGSVGGIVLFAEDITALKESEGKLRLAANVFMHAFEGILITDANGDILEVNDAFTRITGYPREEVLGRNPRFLNSGRQNREFYADMWKQLEEKGHWSGEIWNRAKSGQIYAETLTISAVPDAEGKTQQYVALFSDLSYAKEQEEQLARVAHYDLLTGLPNRVLLADRVRQAIAQAHGRKRMVAIACLDLDGFKAINDEHGHNIGDQLLTAITKRMNTALRDGDTLARLGGDEFVAVLLDLLSVEDSFPVITRLLQAAAEPVDIGELTVQVSASLGVTFYPQVEEVDADQLLRQSNQAMYHAKVSGKNRYHIFDPMEDRSIRGQHEDLERVRVALQANEFVLHFQPRVNMSSGAILSAEALVRWRHPEQGLLAPAQFMPILEGNPLVIELGEWVISNALKQIEQWRDEGLDLPVSVNIDAQQLQHPDFVNRLAALLAEHPDVPPSRLELEVLESGALRDIAAVSQVIRTCNKLGVAFALDDFGTGYSSLSYLKRLPVHFLKIDQTFVHDMLDDSEDLTILEGVLGLANAFRREAVAEGVETVDHGLMLLRLGCQLAQGFGIARPMPGNELPDWAANWRPDPRWANVSPIDPAHFPLLYAGVEHRAWIGAISEYLHGKRHIPPLMDSHLCRFGAWLDDEASAGRGGGAGFQAIDALHQRLHSCANELLALKADGRDAEALAGLSELRTQRDNLLERLQYFVQAL